MSTNTKSTTLKSLEAEYFRLARQETSTAIKIQLDKLEAAIRHEKRLDSHPKDIKLIGISGKMKHGKDTFYDFIKQACPQAVRVAFADALKKEVAEACGVTVDFINANKDKFRTILQWWGTEFRRGLYGDDYWLRRLEDTIYKLPDGSVVFVTDVRFLNEADFVRQMGGTVVKVVRIGGPESAAGIAQHASEMELEKINAEHTICAASLEELKSIATMWWEKQK